MVTGSVIDFDQTVHGPYGEHVPAPAAWRQPPALRVWLTGASGFVGSNIARVFETPRR